MKNLFILFASACFILSSCSINETSSSETTKELSLSELYIEEVIPEIKSLSTENYKNFIESMEFDESGVLVSWNHEMIMNLLGEDQAGEMLLKITQKGDPTVSSILFINEGRSKRYGVRVKALASDTADDGGFSYWYNHKGNVSRAEDCDYSPGDLCKITK